jgi:hypothetical protein
MVSVTFTRKGMSIDYTDFHESLGKLLLVMTVALGAEELTDTSALPTVIDGLV